MPIFTWRFHFPDQPNRSFEATGLGSRRYPVLEETVVMHELDEGTEEEGATLKRTADFALDKHEFDIAERRADLQQRRFSLCVDLAYQNTVSC